MSAQGDSYPDAATEAVRDDGGWPSHVRDDFACGMDFDEDAVARARAVGGRL